MKKFFCIFAVYIIGTCSAWSQETLTLHNACELALKNSVKLERLKAKIQSSRMIVHERWRELLPNVSFQYSKSDTVAIREDDTRFQSLACTVQYDIFTNQQSLIAYSIAQIESMLANEEYTIEKNNIILSTKQAYFALQNKRKSIEIYQLLLKSLQLQKNIITAQQQLGMATELELIQVDGKIAEAQYNILSAQNQYANSLQDFATTLGINYASIQLPEQEYAELQNITMASKENLISLSMQNRNELKKSYYTLIKTQKEYQLAQYYYLPRIQLFASYGYSGTEFPINKKMWNVGLSVTSLLFGNTASLSNSYGKKDNGNATDIKSSASVAVYDNPSFIRSIIDAEAAYTEAQKYHQQLIQIIRTDVSKAYDTVMESLKKVEIARQTVLLLEKQSSIENEQARLGDITRYDVLKTLVELSQARLRLQETITDVFVSMAALENAVGLPIESIF
ncbi:MAG: TolC family protein [Spirochaetes bacterium]|nr:TolC family protein [Spirochaetota bacterium]